MRSPHRVYRGLHGWRRANRPLQRSRRYTASSSRVAYGRARERGWMAGQRVDPSGAPGWASKASKIEGSARMRARLHDILVVAGCCGIPAAGSGTEPYGGSLAHHRGSSVPSRQPASARSSRRRSRIRASRSSLSAGPSRRASTRRCSPATPCVPASPRRRPKPARANAQL